MAKSQSPSAAQARLIAYLWSERGKGCLPIGETAADPTHAACVKRGWLVPEGQGGTFPNGAPFKIYVLSDTAEDALEDYLRHKRYRREDTKL